MRHSLLFKNSLIFEESNLIDRIRQSYIDIGINSYENEDDIHDFLNQSIELLENDISNDVAIELFDAILHCFEYYSNSLTNEIHIFLKKSKSNANFIIITSSLIYFLNRNQPQLITPECQTFIDETVNELSVQIKGISNNKLTIFGHEIPSMFANDFIIDIFLSSKLTTNIIFSLMPYIFHQNKFSFFNYNSKNRAIYEKILNSGLMKILPLDEKSNQQIFEFITNKNLEQIITMNKNAFSIVLAAIITLYKGSCNDEGITEENVLPFLAIMMILIEKSKTTPYFTFNKLNNLITNSLRNFENNQIPVIIASIDIILQYYVKMVNRKLISNDCWFQIIFILTKQLISNQYSSDKILLLNSIFVTSSFDDFEMLTIYFKEFIIDIFDYVLKHYDEINNDDLKKTKLNLMFIEPVIFVNYLEHFSTANDVIKILNFVENFSYNLPIIVSTPELSNILMSIIDEKIKEESWDDILLIGEFMKKNDFADELLAINEFKIPKSVKLSLFNSLPDENDCIDDSVNYLLTVLLSDPNVENNDSYLKSLFDLMIKDDEILQSYLSYLIYSFSHYTEFNSFTINGMLKLFKKELELYNDKFIDIINRMLYNNQASNTFMPKESCFLSTLPISKFGQSVIFKLLDSIKKKPGNYEAFIVLKHIASSFPFLFDNLFNEVTDIVSENMKSIDLIVENIDNDEKNMRIVKTTYVAISFYISVLQSSLFMDQFFKWFFKNMHLLNDNQLLGYWTIMEYLNRLTTTHFDFHVSINKFNIFEKIGVILERKFENNTINNLLRQKIYFFLCNSYDRLEKVNNYVIIQKDEVMKIDNHIDFIHKYMFSNFNRSFFEFDIKINGISKKLTTFIQKVERKRDFWIDYPRPIEQFQDPTTDEINEFCKKLTKYEPLTVLPDISNIQSKITVKMTRYIVVKQIQYYFWILYNENTSFVDANKTIIDDIIKTLNEMQNQAKENPDDKENIDANLLDCDEYILSLYCQSTLFKSLVRDLTDLRLAEKGYLLIMQLITQISKNEVSFLSFLEFISQYFSEITEKCNDDNLDSSINELISLIDALIQLSEINGFKENFIDLCGNNIINNVLKPILRSQTKLLLKVIDLFLIIGNDLPIRITQIICIMFSFTSINLDTTFQLVKRFDINQIINIKHYIFTCFENAKKNLQISSLFIEFAKIFPSIIQEKNDQLYELLDGMLQKYILNGENDNYYNNSNDNLSLLIDILVPKKQKITNLIIKNDKSIEIPQTVKETSPSFWNIFEKYSAKIIERIEANPSYLLYFQFLCENSELFDFKIRSSYFRQKMKKRINYGQFHLKVDRKNILTTSYKCFLNKTNEQILKSFSVSYDGERSIDAGGPKREWFTTLSREIMNQNYGLFECSKNTKCYQPSRYSNINPNHIDYFRFAGKFIARSLIEGQCIDAHFTTSFIKQILKREVSYKDIEDFDEELYKNLEWMLHNDVDTLCMFFEIDTKELGSVKTIELKENGSQTKVTNENKVEYVNLRANYALKDPIKKQVDAFCDGFYSLIDYDDIKIFSPKELDLLICGIPEIDAGDFIANTIIDHPYNAETPVIKYFFEIISNWENDKLAKLLLFMTGSSRVPSNGFKEFCEMTGHNLRVSFGGDKSRMPQSHTCFNTIDLPQYESYDELKEKLILAIEECNTFEMS